MLEEIRSYAQSAGLDVAIFNQENQDVPFFGSVSAAGNSTLVFDMDPSFINWRVFVNLPNDWYDNLLLLISLTFLSMGASVFTGVFVYKYLKNGYKIPNMSTHDFLTGLYNRHFLDGYQAITLSAAKREKREAAILMIDLNHFKEVNDTYGHGIGDKVLIETARVLQKFTRAGEAAFRLGGDEFLLMLPEINNENSLQAAKERLAKCFQEEFKIPGYPIKVTFSIGHAFFPEDGEDIDALLRAADRLFFGITSRIQQIARATGSCFQLAAFSAIINSKAVMILETKDVIIELRKHHNLSQDEMAERLFVTRQAVSRWETGETMPNTETLKLISKKFGVSIDVLLGTPQCQSCGMTLYSNDVKGSEHDGSKSEEYCTYCYGNGTFLRPMTLEEAIEHNIEHLNEWSEDSGLSLTPDEARAMLREFLPTLKRWKAK